MDKDFVQALKQVVSDILNVEVSKVSDNLSPDTIEGWDSFNHLVIISAVEEQLGIVFTSNEIEQIKSFGDLKRIADRRGRAHG